MYDTDIYHFGVKGMKWGQRKRRESSSTGRSSGRFRDQITVRRAVGGVVGARVAGVTSALLMNKILKQLGIAPAASVVASNAFGLGLSVAGAYGGVKIADMHGGTPEATAKRIRERNAAKALTQG